MSPDATMFKAPPDLSDPAQLADQCDELAATFEQQAEAHRTRGAAGGHPDPVHWYRHTAAVLRAAGKVVAAPAPPAPTSDDNKGADKPPETPKPAPAAPKPDKANR